jgi:lipopolysaccharide export system permease protein
MKQLDRYLGKTVAAAMLLASAGLVGLLVLFTFLEQLQDLKNDYTYLMVIHYVALSIPRMFYETVPYAALIGCLAGLGRLANNSELIVMRSAGVSTWKIALGAMKPALGLVLFSLFIGELVLPDFEREARTTRENAMEDDITPDGGFWYREMDTYMHFNAVSHDGQLSNINQYFLDTDRELIKTLWAETAVYRSENDGQTGSGVWRFENVIISDLAEDKKTFTHLPALDWKTTLTPTLLNTEILVDADKMSITELQRKINHLQAQGLNTGKFEVGLWSKLLQPVATLSLVFIAISFIFGPLRETTMGMRVVTGLVVGILFKFAQDLLSPSSQVFGFSPLLATLVPIVICVSVGYILLRRAN